MILRGVALRHGRRALATSRPPPAIRQLSTDLKPEEGKAEDAPDEIPLASEKDQAVWTVHSPAAPPIIPQSSKRKKQRSTQEIIAALSSDAIREHQGASWSRPHKIGKRTVSPAQQYFEFQRIKKNTRKLGSQVVQRYDPSDLVVNPMRPEDVTLELLMASQTHMGHNTSTWNPANSRYILGVRQGIHIIALETTAAHLRRAARVVEEVSYRGGLILFAGTRKHHMEIVTRAAKLAGACHLFTKWTPGAITNRDVILKNRLKKVVDHLDKELDEFDDYNGTNRPLVPDLVVCLNPLENYTLLYECGLRNIPTIGVIDTNANPSWVTYTIPSNDDSLRAIALIGGVLGRAGERGNKRRLEDAAKGHVPWKTSQELHAHMSKEVAIAKKRFKEVMGRTQSQVEGFTEEEKKMLRSHYDDKAPHFDEADMVKALGETATEGKKQEGSEASAVQVQENEAKGGAEVDGKAEVEGKMKETDIGSGTTPEGKAEGATGDEANRT